MSAVLTAARIHLLALCAALPALTATAAPAAPAVLNFTADEKARILAHGPWPPAVAHDRSNRAERRPAAVAWGRELFFDARLSADGRSSCASCHQPAQAFQDARSSPQPPAAAPAEAAAPLRAGHRNTPSLLGTAHQRWWGWDGAHDSLWAAIS